MTDPIFSKGEYDKLHAWLDLKGAAAVRRRVVERRGAEIELGAGDLVVSLSECAAKWRWDRVKVLRFLKRLSAAGYCTVRSDQNMTIIHIGAETTKKSDTVSDTVNDTVNDTVGGGCKCGVIQEVKEDAKRGDETVCETVCETVSETHIYKNDNKNNINISLSQSAGAHSYAREGEAGGGSVAHIAGNVAFLRPYAVSSEEEYFAELKRDRMKAEAACMRWHIGQEEYDQMLEQIRLQLIQDGRGHANYGDYTSHVANVMLKMMTNKQNSQRYGNSKQSNSGADAEEARRKRQAEVAAIVARKLRESRGAV